MEETEDATFKVILLGDSSVGKSCITTQFVEGRFQQTTKATIGCDYAVKRITIGVRVVKLEVWDTVTPIKAGQEAYRAITRSFYKLANAAVLVYALTRKSTFDSIDFWLKELRVNTDPALPVYLAGNMLDLEGQREVPAQDGKDFCSSRQLQGFWEVSAKTGSNLDKLFAQAAGYLLSEHMTSAAMGISRYSIPSVLKAETPVSEKKKKECC